MRKLALCGAFGVCLCVLGFAQREDEPAPFAGGFFSNASVLGISFSSDGKTFYLSQSYTHVLSSSVENGRWIAPKPLPFSGGPYRDGDPFLSPDGNQLFFWSSRPIAGQPRQGLSLWVADRAPKGWSAPRPLSANINRADSSPVFPSVTADGTLYFTDRRPDSLGARDIYRARKTPDGYAEPENLGPPVSSEHDEWDAYVAPDESFIVFASARPAGAGRPSLYVSARTDEGWTTPRDIGPAIGGLATCCPAVSPDGQYLFFSGMGGIYRAGIAALGLTRKPGSQQTQEAPKLFEPGIIAVPGAFAVTFSPDGKTAYFSESGSALMTSRFENGRWSTPEALGFSGRNTDIFPFLSADGSQLLFTSSRERPGQPPGLVLWAADRAGNGWSEPRDIGAPVNSGVMMNGSGSFAANGTLYYAARRLDSKTRLDLYRARREGQRFAEPEDLGPIINSSADERELFVAPDETYLIFTSDRPGGFGASDLYISIRKDGAWTTPRNAGPKINSAGPECCATVSPDGRKLYFVRSGPNGGVFEVGIEAIKQAAAPVK